MALIINHNGLPARTLAERPRHGGHSVRIFGPRERSISRIQSREMPFHALKLHLAATKGTNHLAKPSKKQDFDLPLNG